MRSGDLLAYLSFKWHNQNLDVPDAFLFKVGPEILISEKRTDGRMDRHTLLQRCENASKNYGDCKTVNVKKLPFSVYFIFYTPFNTLKAQAFYFSTLEDVHPVCHLKSIQRQVTVTRKKWSLFKMCLKEKYHTESSFFYSCHSNEDIKIDTARKNKLTQL